MDYIAKLVLKAINLTFFRILVDAVPGFGDVLLNLFEVSLVSFLQKAISVYTVK